MQCTDSWEGAFARAVRLGGVLFGHFYTFHYDWETENDGIG